MATIDLKGKIALVTGSSSGIGRAIAVALAAGGAKVAVNYLRSREDGEETVRTIREAGGEAELFQADVSKVDAIEALVRAVEETFGAGVDILVNNAGHLVRRCPNADMTEELYETIMDVNFKSAVFVTKAVLPGMKAKGGGAIVNLSSLAAHDGGGPGASVYAASKAAIVSYSKGLAKELAPAGIRVNTVSPGFIGRTAFHATFTSEEGRKATVGRVPLGREGTPDDVAGAVLYLVSGLAAYVTGETIEINGGLFMR
ncbi:SDR family NAD(P)-dependent oxidoreductase [Paenibacillus flagellatus]|uniref:Oxidoreductase n=1 Tax=Paenibacillus flagellatus TaxID=2211139 RepID=A0A2V5K4V4_9BACL|nr:3-oxoacyl-ACP reductase family protein [Paenibacillus flagellatus]PYI54321.1 oxidoreductase [Paenibacillus flagellatus]